MLKLNSIPNDMFEKKKVNDRVVKINELSISRNELVSTGRLLLCEHSGRAITALTGSKESFNSICEREGIDFGSLSKNHQREKFLFCAAIANLSVGREAPASYEDAVKEQLQYAHNAKFWEAFNAIDVDVISPLFPTITEDVALGGLMQTYKVPLGQTLQLDVKSNDVFLFEDSAWGSGRSTTKNYLYGKSVTLTPKMYASNATIKWYQDIVNGEAGRYYAAILNGMLNKIYAIFMSQLNTAAGNTKYVPSGLKTTTYSTDNWNAICTKVAVVNGVRRTDLMAFGQISELSKILPTDSTPAAITGLQYGLGAEWFRRGYLPNASGVQLVEVYPVVIPGTQNSTVDTINLGNNIYVAAKGGQGYAPLAMAVADGSPITIVATPSDTADFTIDMNIGAMFDIKPVFASKIGVIADAS